MALRDPLEQNKDEDGYWHYDVRLSDDDRMKMRAWMDENCPGLPQSSWEFAELFIRGVLWKLPSQVEALEKRLNGG